MFCQVLDYDVNSGVATVFSASSSNIFASGMEYNVMIDPKKLPKWCRIQRDMVYSFFPKDFESNGVFLRGELDYNSPLIKR